MPPVAFQGITPPRPHPQNNAGGLLGVGPRLATRPCSALTEGTRYTWRVGATNGTHWQWSEDREFVTSSEGLNPSILVSPVAGDSAGLPVVLRWQAEPLAERYGVEVNATDDFTEEADWTFAEITATEQSLAGVGLVEGETYWWRAQACHVHGCSYWTAPAAFVAADPSGGGSEGLVTLTVPDDGATGVVTDPQLRWSWSGDVVDGPPGGFRVRIAQGGVVLYQNYETGSSTSHNVPGATLAEGTTYTWTVAALRGDASVIHEPMGRTFTTAGTPPAAPPVPTLAAPDSGAVNVPTSVPFAWQASAGAASYRLEVATDQNFGQVQVVQTLADTSHVASLAQDQTYWWRVQACDGAGGTGVCSAWGGPRPFTTTDGEVKRYYYVRDHLGSVRATVNEAGVVVHYADYYPFGTVMPGRSMDAEAPKENYTGHELDEETELLYAGARYLDPAIGRWTTVDPLAEKFSSWSPYNYALDNPIILFDPDGAAPLCCGEGAAIRQDHQIYSRLGRRKPTPSPRQVATATDLALRSVVEPYDWLRFGIDQGVDLYEGDFSWTRASAEAALAVTPYLAGGFARSGSRLLESASKSRVVRNALEDHELAQAHEVVALRGGHFEGAPSGSYPGIDGWLDGTPVSLKAYGGRSPVGVLKHIAKANSQLLSAGISGAELYISAPGINIRQLVDFVRGNPNAGISGIVNEGNISSIYVRTDEGWFTLAAAR